MADGAIEAIRQALALVHAREAREHLEQALELLGQAPDLRIVVEDGFRVTDDKGRRNSRKFKIWVAIPDEIDLEILERRRRWPTGPHERIRTGDGKDSLPLSLREYERRWQRIREQGWDRRY